MLARIKGWFGDKWSEGRRLEYVPLTWRLLRTGIGLCYLLAFASLIPQILPIYGSGGLQPLTEYYHYAWQQDGLLALLKLPSLLWLSTSDAVLAILPWAGVVMAVVLTLGFFARWAAFACWVLLLSFSAGHNWFIWDSLLLESGFLLWLSLFVKHRNAGATHKLFRWAFRLLVFRLWFSMGIVKIYLSDPSWYDLTFMHYYWPNQPMPTPAAWYLAPLPDLIQRAIALLTLVAEHLLPIWMFSKRRSRRHIAFWGLAALSVLIQLGGNFAYFNILTIVLGIPILLESDWNRLLRITSTTNQTKILPVRAKWSIRLVGVQALLQLMYLLHLAIPSTFSVNSYNFPFANQVTERVEEVAPPAAALTLPFKLTAWARISNPYGVFRFIGWNRYRLKVEFSKDGKNWQLLIQKHPPGEVFAPYFPRIDHSFFYVAQGHYLFMYDHLYGSYHRPDNMWFTVLLTRLQKGDQAVSPLFLSYPSSGNNYVRVTRLKQHFATVGKWEESEPRLLFTLSPKDSIPHAPFYLLEHPQIAIYKRFFLQLGVPDSWLEEAATH